MAAHHQTRWPRLLIGATLVVPVGIALLYLFAAPPLALFVVGRAAIAVLAESMRRASSRSLFTPARRSADC